MASSGLTDTSVFSTSHTEVGEFSSPVSKFISTVPLYGSAVKSTSKQVLQRSTVKPSKNEARKIALAIIENILAKQNDKILPRHYKQFAIRMSKDKILSQSDSDLRVGLDQAFIEHSYHVLFRFLHIVENLMTNKLIYSNTDPEPVYTDLVDLYQKNSANNALFISEAEKIISESSIKPLDLIKLVGSEAFDTNTITELTGVNIVAADEVFRRRKNGATKDLDFFDFQDSDVVKPQALAKLILNKTINPLSLVPLFANGSQKTLLQQIQIIIDNFISYFERNKRPNEDKTQVLFAPIFFSDYGKNWFKEQQEALLQRINPKDIVSSDEDHPNVDTIAADSHEVAVQFIIDNLTCLNSELKKFNQDSGLFKTKSSGSTPVDQSNIIHQQCQLMRSQLTADQESTFAAQEENVINQAENYGQKYEDCLQNTVEQTPFRESMHSSEGARGSESKNQDVLNYKLTQEERHGYLTQLLAQPRSWARNRLIAVAVKEGAHGGLPWQKLREINLVLKQLKNAEVDNLQQVQTSDWQSQVEVALVNVVQYVNDEISKATDDNRKSLLTNKLNAVHKAVKDLNEQQKPVKQVLQELKQNQDIKKKSMLSVFKAKTLNKLNKISIAVAKYEPSMSDLNAKQSKLEQLATQCVALREEKEKREEHRNSHVQLASTLLQNVLADLEAKINSSSIFITKNDKAIYKARKEQVLSTLDAITELKNTCNDMFSSPEPSQQEKTVEQQQADLLANLSQCDAVKSNRSAWACFYQDPRTALEKKLQAIAIMTGGQGYKPGAPAA